MDEKFDQAFQQAATFQKMWTDSFSQMAEVWTRASPGKPPPDVIREMRSGMLKVLADCWEEFMRTPQFMEYMKNSMDGVLALRKLGADMMTRNHHATQSPAREDIDGVLLAIRHMERRLLDRIEEVDAGIAEVGRRVEKLEELGNAPPPRTTRKGPTRKSSAQAGI
ncbi:MAG TPA: hypothetical protein VGA56_26235 [Opitutaceae bacterium]